MDIELRRACVVALGELGRGGDYRDRADAGQALAAFAEVPEAAGVLGELLLDVGDTFVTLATARALLRRGDRCGLALVAAALAAADWSRGEWIHTAVTEVFGIFAEQHDQAVRLCEELAGEADDSVSAGARELLDMLAGIDPVLRPDTRSGG
ncbi:hypothetical protein [Kitasatospora viridis]|uniref:HEAT repeat protein n=1 Tax=Kitasatospora viridis TaxID=281105 RepID=A0A561UD60_9ACTN|nr:hypothetical protein [Kitasatospora viridis]TWF97314.1 hypothetical protein FHX73_111094 [Kitasatospora viridis]